VAAFVLLEIANRDRYSSLKSPACSCVFPAKSPEFYFVVSRRFPKIIIGLAVVGIALSLSQGTGIPEVEVSV
jgi:hypothetical protein